jgi:hypothetical protein
MSTKERKPKENIKVDAVKEVEEAMIKQEQGKKLKQVFTLKDLIETPNSYFVAKPRASRIIITLTNFNGERLKIRITQPVSGRFIQIVNVNYDRLQDVINILSLLKQRLDESGASQKFIKQQSEELF